MSTRRPLGTIDSNVLPLESSANARYQLHKHVPDVVILDRARLQALSPEKKYELLSMLISLQNIQLRQMKLKNAFQMFVINTLKANKVQLCDNSTLETVTPKKRRVQELSNAKYDVNDSKETLRAGNLCTPANLQTPPRAASVKSAPLDMATTRASPGESPFVTPTRAHSNNQRPIHEKLRKPSAINPLSSSINRSEAPYETSHVKNNHIKSEAQPPDVDAPKLAASENGDAANTTEKLNFLKYKKTPTWSQPRIITPTADFHERVTAAASSAMDVLLRKGVVFDQMKVSDNRNDAIPNAIRGVTSNYKAESMRRDIAISLVDTSSVTSIKDEKYNEWRKRYTQEYKNKDYANFAGIESCDEISQQNNRFILTKQAVSYVAAKAAKTDKQASSLGRENREIILDNKGLIAVLTSKLKVLGITDSKAAHAQAVNNTVLPFCTSPASSLDSNC